MNYYMLLYILLIIGLIIIRLLVEELYVRKEREEIKATLIDLKSEVSATKKVLEIFLKKEDKEQ